MGAALDRGDAHHADAAAAITAMIDADTQLLLSLVNYAETLVRPAQDETTMRAALAALSALDAVTRAERLRIVTKRSCSVASNATGCSHAQRRSQRGRQVSGRSTHSSARSPAGTIDAMAVHVDASLPVHPLTVDDLEAMVQAGILAEDDRVELLDGVLVEMSPQGNDHAGAVARLNMLLAPIAAAAGLVVSPQCPLDVLSPISQPEPDLAVVPEPSWEAYAAQALLVIEVSVTSRAVDLGRKAAIYAAAGIPDYWVLDIARRRLVVHREPVDDRYAAIEVVGDTGVITAARLPLTIAVAEILPPAS